MLGFAESRFACLGAFIALSLAMGAGTAMAQAQRPMSPPDASAPAPALPAEKMSTGMLEGSVEKVDPGAGNIQVSLGPFGGLRKTLEVTGETQIRVEGRQATLADIREGAKVKASYDSHEGKNVATGIDAMPSRDSEKSSPGRSPTKSR